MELTLPIREVAAATARSRLLRLDLRGQPFAYRAGQGALLGSPDQPVRRPYSLTSAPHETAESGLIDFLVGVDETGSPGSHLSGMRPGLPLWVEGPIGAFVLPDALVERHLLFIAGGTGIAPLRAMLADALGRGDASIEADVLYTARTSEDFAFERELRALAHAGRIRLYQTVTRAAAPGWPGARGRVNREQLADVLRTPETLCFVCGPHGLVEEVPRLLLDLGVPPRRIRVEEWSA